MQEAGEGSGDRRGAVLDGSQGTVGYNRGGETVRGCQTPKGKAKAGKRRQWERGDRGQDGVLA